MTTPEGDDRRRTRKTGSFAELHVLYALANGQLRTADLPARISNLSSYAAGTAIATLRARQHVEPVPGKRGFWRITKLGAAHLRQHRKHLDLPKGGDMHEVLEPGPNGESHDNWNEVPTGDGGENDRNGWR